MTKKLFPEKLSLSIKRILFWGLIISLLGSVGCVALFLVYIGVITHQIDSRIEELHNAHGSKFFAWFHPLKKGQAFTQTELRLLLEQMGYQEERTPDDLVGGQYAWGTGDTPPLLLVRPPFSGAGRNLPRAAFQVNFKRMEANWVVDDIKGDEPIGNVDFIESPPKKIAAYVAGRLRTQDAVPLSDIPVTLRLAVMAIEDINFLEHSGVSLRSTVRALWRDLRTRRFAEGGSTITQQLMKNLFFSREKAVIRKIKEAIFAFVTESRHSKEDILEAYLNEVYLGQQGPHEIHGMSEAARYYFNRPVSELTLAQSATLAAIIQAPNLHDPRRYPDRAFKRRNVVLKQMVGAGFILDDEYESAIRETLAVVPADRSLDDADYFIDLVMERLPSNIRSRLENQAMMIHTSLDPYLQVAAMRLLRANIDRLKKATPAIAEKEKRGLQLQSALIAINPSTCSVLALQGGRSYRQTQFNRILQGKRQAGSLFKPFVYLTAFDSKTSPPITPMTEIDDTPFEWKYDKQVWKPKNYDNEYRQRVTARQALELSLNIPTARLANVVGVANIVDNLMRAGVRSSLPVVPSVSLGSADVTPLEVAESYTTLANIGRYCSLQPFVSVFDEHGNMLFQNDVKPTETLPPNAVYQTVHVLKGVFQHGTGRGALASGLPLQYFAGKTGTTNDYKDAWFVGFSPELLTLVWVGYDDAQPVGLTGAAAALPLWIEFTKAALPFLSQAEFPIPDGLVGVKVDPYSHKLATSRCLEQETEYFLKGTEPTENCPLHR